jgi:hypothetical protein
MQVLEKYIYVKKICKLLAITCICIAVFSYAKKEYSNPDFGKTFGTKAQAAKQKLQSLNEQFLLCSKLCSEKIVFMQSLVFPEVMRYNSLKDGIETESLRTLYVQFGQEYANFSIGIFQMKPTFAVQVETKAKQLLPNSIYKDLQLMYEETDEESIREKRVERLQDDEWQLVYLTAFICICNETCKQKSFVDNKEKLQWYATVYNAGFDKTDTYISQKIKQENFYLNQGMPEKKFKYAAIASWYYNKPL